jgi:hypothetical protein
MNIPDQAKARLGDDMIALITNAQPDKPLIIDAPKCDSAHGCGKMRRRDTTTTLTEDGFTQLTYYVCETSGCPFEGIPYQIRERGPVV